MKTILAVEDEKDILELIEYTLHKNGYDVVGLMDTAKINTLLDEEDISLILMDRNLPGCEGSEYIQKLRSDGYMTPVIYLSAKDSNEDKLVGFERGADDYITKPFNPEELVARIKAVLKRSDKEIDVIKFRDIVYDKLKNSVFIGKNEIKLSKLDKKLLNYFMINPNILLSTEEILESVWEDSSNKKLKTVVVAINRLKEKIDPHFDKEYIKNLRGEGYILC